MKELSVPHFVYVVFAEKCQQIRKACAARKKGYAGASQWFLETFVWILKI